MAETLLEKETMNAEEVYDLLEMTMPEAKAIVDALSTKENEAEEDKQVTDSETQTETESETEVPEDSEDSTV